MNIKKISSFHIFSPFGLITLLVIFLVFGASPLFYAIEVFLLANYLYRYVPVLTYLLRSGAIKKKLNPLPSKDIDHKYFIVLVPAKNEAEALPGLLTSIQQQDYPKQHFKVVVVADNCTDATAEVARKYGAECIEKNTVDAQPGKGACMAYACKVFMEQVLPPDTHFVITDADCELEPGYLSEVNKKLNEPSPASVLQSYRYVKNSNASVVASLDAASEEVRQLIVLGNRDMLGLNAFLHGSGTIYEKSVFFRMATRGDRSAAEDKEWNAWLLEEKVRIKWCPSAKLNYSVYERNEEFQKQRVRWVRGQFITAKKFAARALLQGIAKRDLSQIDYSFSLYQLPRSVLIFMMLICSVVNYLYFHNLTFAYSWLAMCAVILPCEMMGLKMSRMDYTYKDLLATGFKMIWGVARSSVASSLSFTTSKFWPDRKEIFKGSAK